MIHNGDHLRRGVDRLSPDVFWLGMVGIVLEVGVVVVIFQRHPMAPRVAANAGGVLAAGYLVVHFLPPHALFSDSLTSAPHVSPLSLSAAALEVVAALMVALAGAWHLRTRGDVRAATAPSPGERSVVATLHNPVVSIMVLSQAVTMALSFVQFYG